MDLLSNMAMRYRHDYGLLSPGERIPCRVQMSQLAEEVVYWLEKRATQANTVPEAIGLKDAAFLIKEELFKARDLTKDGFPNL